MKKSEPIGTDPGPLTTRIVEWIDSAAPSDGDFHVWMLIFTPPGVFYDGDPSEPWSKVRTRVLAVSHDPFDQMGSAVALIGAIDLVFHGRSTEQDWSTISERHREFVEALRSRGHESLAEKMATGGALPLRAQQWIRAAKSWRDLRNQEFSSGELSRWLQDSLSIKSRQARLRL